MEVKKEGRRFWASAFSLRLGRLFFVLHDDFWGDSRTDGVERSAVFRLFLNFVPPSAGKASCGRYGLHREAFQEPLKQNVFRICTARSGDRVP